MKPTRISRSGETELTITWDDGHSSVYPFQLLRDNCPCATCNEYSDAHSSLLPLYKEGKYSLTGVKQVGQYAVQITWQDGHDTGIYTYEILRRLCRCRECIADKK